MGERGFFQAVAFKFPLAVFFFELNFNFSVLNISSRTEQRRAVCVALALVENALIYIPEGEMIGELVKKREAYQVWKYVL